MALVAQKATTIDGESTYVDSEDVRYLRVTEDGVLEYSLDGETWEAVQQDSSSRLDLSNIPPPPSPESFLVDLSGVVETNAGVASKLATGESVEANVGEFIQVFKDGASIRTLVVKKSEGALLTLPRIPDSFFPVATGLTVTRVRGLVNMHELED